MLYVPEATTTVLTDDGTSLTVVARYPWMRGCDERPSDQCL